jgi:RNA polymerase-interacting CarD/CdnL/TRCF family regulator
MKIGNVVYCNGYGLGRIIDIFNSPNFMYKILLENQEIIKLSFTDKCIRALSSKIMISHFFNNLQKQIINNPRTYFKEIYPLYIETLEKKSLEGISYIIRDILSINKVKKLSEGETHMLNTCYDRILPELSFVLRKDQKIIKN